MRAKARYRFILKNSTRLRIVDVPSDLDSVKPGDMWPCDSELHTFEERGPCWSIFLGLGEIWHTNGETASRGEFWKVKGTPPRITVFPSVDMGRFSWHGWIEGGRLWPDLWTRREMDRATKAAEKQTADEQS